MLTALAPTGVVRTTVLPRAVRTNDVSSAGFDLSPSTRALVLILVVYVSAAPSTLQFIAERAGATLTVGQRQISTIAATAYAAGAVGSIVLGPACVDMWLTGAQQRRQTGLPPRYRVRIVHGGAGSWEYEVVALETPGRHR